MELRWLPLLLAAVLAPFVQGEVPAVETEVAACCCNGDGSDTPPAESCAHGCTDAGDCAPCQLCRAQVPAALGDEAAVFAPPTERLSPCLGHEFAEQRVDRPAAPPPKA